MKKIVLTLFALLLLFDFVNAQEMSTSQPVPNSHPSSYNDELAINATFFIKEFLSFNNSIVNPISPYFLTYKRRFGFNVIRTGIGFRISDKTEDQEFGDGTLENKNNRLDFRLGYERQVPIAKKWLLSMGFDGIFGKQNFATSFENGFDVVQTTENTDRYGAGPILGIQFFINERLSLSTEGSMYYEYTFLTEKVTSREFPEVNSKKETKDHNFTFNLPVSLFFGVWF